MFRLGTSLHAVTLVGPDGVTRPAPRRVDVPEQAVRVWTGRRVGEAGVRRVERVPQGGAAAVVGLGHEVVQLVRHALRGPLHRAGRADALTLDDLDAGRPVVRSVAVLVHVCTSVSGRVWVYVGGGRTGPPPTVVGLRLGRVHLRALGRVRARPGAGDGVGP